MVALRWTPGCSLRWTPACFATFLGLFWVHVLDSPLPSAGGLAHGEDDGLSRVVYTADHYEEEEAAFKHWNQQKGPPGNKQKLGKRGSGSLDLFGDESRFAATDNHFEGYENLDENNGVDGNGPHFHEEPEKKRERWFWSKFVGCKSYPVTGCGKGHEAWHIVRAKTWTTRVKTFFKGVLCLALISGIIALSVMSAGLFVGFLTTGAIGASSIASFGVLGTVGSALFAPIGAVLPGAIASAFGASLAGTLAVSGMGMGIIMGKVASHQAGYNYASYDDSKGMENDLKWLQSKKDACDDITFELTHDKDDDIRLFQLEEDTDKKASDAIEKWCGFMLKPKAAPGSNKSRLPEVFDHGGMIPRPTTCQEVNDKLFSEKKSMSRHREERNKSGKTWFTCYDLLGLANEEMTYAAALMSSKIVKAMASGAARKPMKGRSCREDISFSAPGATSMALVCAKKEAAKGRSFNLLHRMQTEEQFSGVGDLAKEDRRQVVHATENETQAHLQQMKGTGSAMGWEDDAGWMDEESSLLEEGAGDLRHEGEATRHRYNSDDLAEIYAGIDEEALLRVESKKAEALHNCMACASCQLLRKDYEILQGKGRSWKNAFFLAQSRSNMTNSVVQRCLSHTSFAAYGVNKDCIVGTPTRIR